MNLLVTILEQLSIFFAGPPSQWSDTFSKKELGPCEITLATIFISKHQRYLWGVGWPIVTFVEPQSDEFLYSEFTTLVNCESAFGKKFD